MKLKNYCGIVFVGGGSAWGWGATPQEAAQTAAREAMKGWRRFIEPPINVNIYDMHNHDGWYADARGVYDTQTHERIERDQVIAIAKP